VTHTLAIALVVELGVIALAALLSILDRRRQP
jgi:hypothetical protein